MRGFRAGFAALVLGTTLAAGCSQGSAALNAVDTDAKAVEALVTKLSSETFKGKATAIADIAAVRDALPKEVKLSWGNLTFDQASGATVLTQVKLTPADMPQVGLGIEELRLYDFDAALAKARLTGQRLSETAPLARRIDAKGVGIFGMAAMLNGISGAGGTSESEVVIIEEPLETKPPAPVAVPPGATPGDDWPPSTEPSFEFGDMDFSTSIDRFDYSFSRVIIDDVVLRPYEVAAAPAPGTPMAQMYGPGSDFFAQYIGVMRAVGIDTFAAFDMKMDMAMTQMGQKVAMSFGAKSMGTRGMRGGDMDASFARGMTVSVDAGEGVYAPTPKFNFQYTLDYFGLEDMRFDKLYAHMAKGTLPPRTETDVISYGSWLFEKQAIKIDGRDIMTVGEAKLDARKFHWFIPTEIKASAKDAMIDFGAITEMAGNFAADMAAAETPAADPTDPEAPTFTATGPSREDIAALVAIMKKHGLDKPNMNFNFGWNWNATSGDTKVDLGFGGDKLMQVDLKYEGGFPSFKAASDLIPDDIEQMNTQALGKLFDEKSTLKAVDINVVDNGGLAKMFDFAADAGQIMAASDPAAAGMMQNQTGASLRQMAGGMLTMLGGASPDMAAFINPMSTFIMQGGKLHIGLRPSQPSPYSVIAQKFMMMDPMAPGATMKELGLKVEHSK